MARIDTTNYYNPNVGKVTILPSTMLNHYLWNSPNEPSLFTIVTNSDGKLWRDMGRKPVTFDANEHMTQGPGRFASIADFKYFRDFFNTAHQKEGVEIGKAYTVTEMDGFIGSDDPNYDMKGADGLTAATSQYTVGVKGHDFTPRAFVFGSEGYEITAEDMANVKFIIHADGSKEVQGVKLRPVQDNFDFESGNPAIQAINYGLKAYLDPMQTGKTVDMKYQENAENPIEAVDVLEEDFRILQKKAADAGVGWNLPSRVVVDYSAYITSSILLKEELSANSEFYKNWIGKFFNIYVWHGPIVVDLDGDGVETVALNSGTQFDHDKNGVAEQTGWAGKDDGLLVMDLNKNKTIDNGGELFGNNTLLADGKTHAKAGFEALAQYDSNKNGEIDAGDARWGDLQIWQDADADGVSDEGELKTLDEIGIVSINLDYTETGETDTQGNLHKQSSSATWQDGKTTDTVDVWFRTEDSVAGAAVTKFTHTEEIDNLPEIVAGGQVHHLRDAMTQDEDLIGQVKDYVANPSEAKLEELIYQWTDTVDVEPRGDHKHVDMRKLAVLEKLADGVVDKDDWSKKDGRRIEEEFDRFVDYVASNIKIQEIYSDVIGGDMVTYDGNGNITADWISVKLHIDKLLSDKDVETASDFTEISADALVYSEKQSDWWVNSTQKMTSAIFHYGEVTDLKKLAELDGTVGDDGNNHLKAGSEHNILLEGAVLFGDDGNDKLKGGKDNDVLVGGAGNDKLEGKGGSDLYVFEKDFGKDKIDSDDDDEGSDVIRFAEYLQTDLNFVRSSDNLVITTKEGDNALKVEDFFEDGKDGASIDSIVFADYSFLDKNAIKDLAETVEVGCGSKATDGHGCFKYAEKLSAPAMHSAPALDEATMEIVG